MCLERFSLTALPVNHCRATRKALTDISLERAASDGFQGLKQIENFLLHISFTFAAKKPVEYKKVVGLCKTVGRSPRSRKESRSISEIQFAPDAH